MILGKKDLKKRTTLKESHIPKLIMYLPIGSIIITAIIVSSLFLTSYTKVLKSEYTIISNRVLDDERLLISNEIEEVFNYIDFNIVNAEKWLIEKLKMKINISYQIIESIYNYNITNKSETEIINIIRETLRNVRFFDGRGYYYIHRHDLDSSDYTILQPDRPWQEGNHQLKDKDINEQLISETTYTLLESDGEGSLSFNLSSDYQNSEGKKFIYVKLFKPLNIFIGTGEYLYNFESELKKKTLIWFEDYRYKKDSYIFIYDNNGKILMHPIMPELVNQNIDTIKDSTGYMFGKEYLKSTKNDTGVYITYMWPNPNSGENSVNIGYGKLHKKWGWNIATGVYMDSVESMIDRKQNDQNSRLKGVIFKTVIIVVSLILTVFLITLFFAKSTESLFSMYNHHIRKSSNELKGVNLSLEKKIKAKTIELEEKNSILEQLVTIDCLTNIYNRRFFDLTFDKEWFRHMRDKNEISLIMCDIDFFKQYNDTYGHQKGDETLKIVGNILKNVCRRPTDIAARYGGEEFALILPHTGMKGALKIALDVQIEINNSSIIHESSKVANILTCSIGVGTVVPNIGEKYSLLIKSTDTALYKAKANGRNRIES